MKNDSENILKKILHYVEYQDRCRSEVMTKLNTFDIDGDEKKKIMQLLEDEGFIDDGRYVRSFVKSKRHLKKWGINKIAMTLKMKGIDNDLIRQALAEIDGDEYRESLENLLKNKNVNETDPYKKKAKLARYAMSKGYEAGLVWEVIGRIEYRE